MKPWPVSTQPFGLTPAYNTLGVSMVVKDPKVWEDDRDVLHKYSSNYKIAIEVCLVIDTSNVYILPCFFESL